MAVRGFPAWSLIFAGIVGVLLSSCDASPQVFVRDTRPPDYPQLARMARVEGNVSVSLEIGADGKVLTASGTGSPILARAAEANARLWSFGFLKKPRKFPFRCSVLYTYKLVEPPVAYSVCPAVIFHLPDRVEIISQPPHWEPSTGGICQANSPPPANRE